MNYFQDPKNMKLKNKIALVTGASSGIGEACARALSGNGAKVILTGRNQTKLKELSEEIGGTFLTANLSISGDIINLFESIDGSIDILVNNAGVAPKAPIIDGKIEAFESLLSINVLALTHAANLHKEFDPKNGGQIVNIRMSDIAFLQAEVSMLQQICSRAIAEA